MFSEQIPQPMNLIENKNPFLLFSFEKGNETKHFFGSIVEVDQSLKLYNELIVVVPKDMLSQFLESSKKELKKVLHLDPLKKIFRSGESGNFKYVPVHAFRASSSEEETNDTFSFIRVQVKKELPFSVVSKSPITDTLNFVRSIYFVEEKKQIKDLSSKMIFPKKKIITASKIKNFFGSPVFDEVSGKCYGIIVGKGDREGDFLVTPINQIIDCFHELHDVVEIDH